MDGETAHRLAAELAPYFPSAEVTTWHVAQGLNFIQVCYPWSSHLPCFIIRTRSEAEQVLASERGR